MRNPIRVSNQRSLLLNAAFSSMQPLAPLFTWADHRSLVNLSNWRNICQ